MFSFQHSYYRAFSSAVLMLSGLVQHPLVCKQGTNCNYYTLYTTIQKLYFCMVSPYRTPTQLAHKQANMTFTANFIGQRLPPPCIPVEEAILFYANFKAMIIPYGSVASLLWCRTSVRSEVTSLSLNPHGTIYLHFGGHKYLLLPD